MKHFSAVPLRALFLGLLALLLTGAAVQVPGPVYKEDPKFPLQGVFADLSYPTMNGAREDSKLFVAWGGPNREWLTAWDLQTGELKSQKPVLRMAERLQVPVLSPSGKYFFQPAVDPKTGSTIINYLDSLTGQPSKTATFNLQNPSLFKVPGTTQDDRFLSINHGGGPLLSGGKPQAAPAKGLPPFRGPLLVNQDYRYALTSDEKQSRLYLIDIDRGKLALDMPIPALGEYANEPMVGAISADGRTLLIRTSTHSLGVVDVPGKKVTKTLSGHGDMIVSFQISADGTRACSLGKDDKLRFWDVKSGAEVAKHSAPWASRLGWSQDLLWVQEPHGAVRTFTGAGVPVGRLRTQPSPRAVVSASGDVMADAFDPGKDPVVTLWKLNPPALIGEHHLDAPAEAVWLSPDGRLVMTRRGADLWVLDVRENKERWSGKTSGKGAPMGLLPEAKGVVLLDGSVIRAEPLGPGEPLWTQDFRPRRTPPRKLRFCAGGRLLCVVMDIPVVIDLVKGEAIAGPKFPAPLPGLEDAYVSDDGKTIVTLQPERREVSWWSAEGELRKTCTFEASGPLAPGEPFSIAPDGGRAFVALRDRILTVNPDGSVSSYQPFAQNFPSFIRVFGDSILLQNGDWSLLLKSATAKPR